MFRSVQSRNSESKAALVDIAPLIDIVFILLIFFLVTATFVRDTGVEVLRPQAAIAESLEPTSMRVSVTSSGDVYADGHRVSLDELRAKVSTFIERERMRSVIVIPDVEVQAGRLIEVMDAARMGGATDVALATPPERSRFMTKRRLARWSRPLTVIAAMLITIVSVWLLGVLNVRATSGLQPRQRIRTVIVRGPESQVTKEEERKDEEPQPEPPDEEIMEVNLDVPLEPMPLEPLELEIALPSPTIPPIQVEVTSPTADASPTAPQANSKKTDVYSASKVDQPPREYRSNRRPPYPAAKLQSGVEGQVTLKLLIDEAGEVKDVKVVAGEPAFVEAVMAVVFDWRFTPAQNRGRPVKVWGLKRVNFRIR